MKYMHLFPFGVDLPATGFCRVFADGPLVLYM